MGKSEEVTQPCFSWFDQVPSRHYLDEIRKWSNRLEREISFICSIQDTPHLKGFIQMRYMEECLASLHESINDWTEAGCPNTDLEYRDYYRPLWYPMSPIHLK